MSNLRVAEAQSKTSAVVCAEPPCIHSPEENKTNGEPNGSAFQSARAYVIEKRCGISFGQIDIRYFECV